MPHQPCSSSIINGWLDEGRMAFGMSKWNKVAIATTDNAVHVCVWHNKNLNQNHADWLAWPWHTVHWLYYSGGHMFVSQSVDQWFKSMTHKIVRPHLHYILGFIMHTWSHAEWAIWGSWYFLLQQLGGQVWLHSEHVPQHYIPLTPLARLPLTGGQIGKLHIHIGCVCCFVHWGDTCSDMLLSTLVYIFGKAYVAKRFTNTDYVSLLW